MLKPTPVRPPSAATPAMTDGRILPFSFPAVRGKKLTAAFDGGRLSSDGGVMPLAAAARRMGIAGKLAAVIPDGRDPTRVAHPLPEILLARILAIARGYADADDLGRLRADPAFKLACGRLPESGADLMSQATVSRWENAPGLRDLLRLGRVLVELYCASHAAPSAAVVLDIDDTLDVVHGRQQLSLFNAHHDERCFLPIHVDDTATARPVAVILRPGKTPSGEEVAAIFAGWSGRSAATGPIPGSPSAATAILAGPSRWPAARRTVSTMSSASPAIARRHARGRHRCDPRRPRCRGPGRAARLCRDPHRAATGRRDAASPPASRRPASASTSATW